ncbi:class I adenylate-forming enzyme family protein [Saccharopolyspora mangrovi]|uniref:Class I adenylate-forming enzyme family protein n=1 Tax=Saccharopolyspora mangrovi TaxID=3082379 RepID=A0ABU6AGH1_9PSEU|nr:class I adenylate-forming enzyme family protein [Saccharopolyspora sp. S2-29]MEB3370531.1 class I adenylate-forming enzyme family protein [Saccharopolyspora sp. S2-29]
MSSAVGQPSFLDEIRAHAERRPTAPAIRGRSGCLSYQELVERIGARARELRRSGIREGNRVAIIADNSPDYLLSAFAIWEAGGVLVTVYPSSGESDLAHCLDSSTPTLVLTEPRLIETVSAVVTGRGRVADINQPLTAEPACPRVADTTVAPDDLALICYTSGSTNRPKAVMHRHRGLLAAAHEFGRVWRVSSQDRTIVSLPMAWAFGLVTTSMTTLLAGGEVLPFARTRPEQIVDAISNERATFLAGVTTMFAKLVAHLRELDEERDFSSLRFCVSGGEPRNEHLFDEWRARTGRQVHDNLASSECFPVITSDPVEGSPPPRGSSGKVVPGAAMRVVAPDGSDVRPGDKGEALWRAPATFAGYWRDAEATAAALTADGWYRTQDLVRVDQDGYVYVEGRLSDMIIRGGSNVSPGEVESVLSEHPAVAEVAVVGPPDSVYGQAVTAVIVPADGLAAEPAELDRFCSSRLAGYKVPSAFLLVDGLPQNSTGKIDRRRVLTDLQEQGVGLASSRGDESA